MKTVALRSLGCKVNAYETEGMQQILQQNGYFVVPFDTKADIYIVNTCSVTNIADHKSRQMLHRAKALNPQAIVVACGCYVQTGRDVLEVDPAVDIIVGNNEKKDIVQILNEYFNNTCEGTLSHVHDINTDNEYEELTVTTQTDHTRAFIKIQDGCNQFCTYCVIPYARGRIRSRKKEDVIREIVELAGKGCKEVVLTGIHISSYGLDREKPELLELIQEINKIDGIERIRLGSLEPRIVTREFAEGIKACNKVCPHFHLSMQSGSAGVLKRMNRHYTPEEYYNGVLILRETFDNPAITTDVIVGFPGETDEEFEETYQFVKKVNFYELHVFKYSRRDGTKAAVMPDQIPEKIKSVRSDKLIKLGKAMSDDYRASFFNTEVAGLIEEVKVIDGIEYWVGHTPEYITVAIDKKTDDDMTNIIVTGMPEKQFENGILKLGY